MSSIVNIVEPKATQLKPPELFKEAWRVHCGAKEPKHSTKNDQPLHAINLTKILDHLGFSVDHWTKINEHMILNNEYVIAIHQSGKKEILIPFLNRIDETNFYLACVLGHYHLHIAERRSEISVDRLPLVFPKKEIPLECVEEATTFAGWLLFMPLLKRFLQTEIVSSLEAGTRFELPLGMDAGETQAVLRIPERVATRFFSDFLSFRVPEASTAPSSNTLTRFSRLLDKPSFK